MAFDQALEQNNKTLKATNGYINVVNKENEKFLRTLEVDTLDIQEYLDGLKDSARSSHVLHKEAMQSFVRQFLSHCAKTRPELILWLICTIVISVKGPT